MARLKQRSSTIKRERVGEREQQHYLPMARAMTMLPHGYDAKVVEVGQAILGQDATLKASITIHNEFLVFAKGNNIGRWEANVHPDEMMVSMFNRNGLMVKPIDVHEKFARIMSAGVDLPDNAFAFEHCPIKGDPLHDVQIQMMEALIRRSNGMLAPLTGRERFCMIATNHCGQSARAVNFGCATPIKGVTRRQWQHE